MKKFFLLVVVVLLSSAALAETVNLKNGQTITGKILEKDAQSIKLESNGVATTYYMDEIKDIDGKTIEAPVPAKAIVDDPKEKRALILKFIEVFGTRKVMAQNFEMMFESLSQEKPDMASKLREKVKVDEIIERLIPLYEKHFTSQELKSYIEFYSSPVGAKLINNISVIMKESIAVSTDYIKEKFPEMAKE